MTAIPEIPTEPCPPEGGRYGRRYDPDCNVRVLAVSLPGKNPICVAWEDDFGSWHSLTLTRDDFRKSFRSIQRKPREWWIVGGCEAWDDKREAEANKPPRAEIVHVREVLE